MLLRYGAAAIGTTIYFGSEESGRQIQEVSQVLNTHLKVSHHSWCYLRNSGFKTNGNDYHTAADLTGKATLKAPPLKLIL